MQQVLALLVIFGALYAYKRRDHLSSVVLDPPPPQEVNDPRRYRGDPTGVLAFRHD